MCHQHTDQPYSVGLLRTRGERPRGSRHTNHFDEIASPHHLTKGLASISCFAAVADQIRKLPAVE
jgi:hypothetical protein